MLYHKRREGAFIKNVDLRLDFEACALFTTMMLASVGWLKISKETKRLFSPQIPDLSPCDCSCFHC